MPEHGGRRRRPTRRANVYLVTEPPPEFPNGCAVDLVAHRIQCALGRPPLRCRFVPRFAVYVVSEEGDEMCSKREYGTRAVSREL